MSIESAAERVVKAGRLGICMCKASGGRHGYTVEAAFQSLEQAQEFYSALAMLMAAVEQERGDEQ